MFLPSMMKDFFICASEYDSQYSSHLIRQIHFHFIAHHNWPELRGYSDIAKSGRLARENR
jgi:hypothetical protein